MQTIKKQWSSGTGEVTINYDGSGNGQITISSDGNNLYEARTMQVVVQTTAGSPQQTKTVNISQAARIRTDISNAVVTAANQTYSGSAKTPAPTVKLNGVTIPSTGYDVTYSNNTNAGTATVTVTGKGDYTGTASGTFTIAKANPTYTAPAAQSLTYNGSSQYLTTAGSTSHGTIQYSEDGTNWYTTRRTKTNAGSYTTYWRLVGDNNHNDVASTSINVTIIQKALTITAKAQTITYGGSIATDTSQVTTSGLVSGDSLTAIALTASTSSVTTSGTITPSSATTTKGISNYSVTYNTGNLTINKANSSVTSAPTAKSLTYSRSAQSLVNTGSASGGTLYYKYTTTNSKPTSTSGFSSSIPTRTDAGTYYVWYYVKGDSNHNDTAISSTAVAVTIAKATPVVATAPSKRTGLSYTGSAQNLLSGGSMKHSSSDSTSVAGTFTYAQGTNAGTYSSLTWSFAPTDSTNYNSTSGTVSGSVSIAQATGRVTTAPIANNPTYSGSSQYIVTAGSGTGTMYYRYRYKSYSESSWGSWSSYSTSRPTRTNAGYYEVEYYADASSDGNYTASSTNTVSCEIYRKSISPTVSMSGWTYGGTASNPSVSGNTGSGTVTYEYKVQGASDSTYTSTKPSNAGSYTVRASIGATTNYSSATCTTNFTIAKASRTISFTNPIVTVAPSGNVTNTATVSAGSGDGAITYSLSSTTYATINSSTGKVTAKTGSGDVTVTATVAAGTNYNSASTSYTLHVTSLYVDLGLSYLWATRNVDSSQSNGFAASPESYGDLFSWGNIEGHKYGSNYIFNSENYANTPGATLTGNISATDSAHDAALANCGSPWRMPTRTIFIELYNNTDNEWTTINGINGYKFMNKSDHSRYIFMPAAGQGWASGYALENSYGIYNYSEQQSSNYSFLYQFDSERLVTVNQNSKYYGRSVRPIRQK